jgi:hypothetical protein
LLIIETKGKGIACSKFFSAQLVPAGSFNPDFAFSFDRGKDRQEFIV